jgi:hypothetical protein
MSLKDHADSLTASCTGSNQAKLTVLPHHPAQKKDLCHKDLKNLQPMP